MIYVWHVAGTTDFTAGGILPAGMDKGAVAVLLALFMFGIGKAALMPFHRWLPAAMVAPTPVSALLHAVAVVKAGVFSVVKVVVYVFGLDPLAGATDWLIAISGFTIVAASDRRAARRQPQAPARLFDGQPAFLRRPGGGMLAPLSIVGAALHIATHAVGKITLFFAAGAIYTAAHKTEVSQLDGIGKRMPWTMAAFTIGALSLIGIPPLAGFVSKWFILMSAAEGGHFLAVAVLIVSTLLNAAYFLPIVHAAFFKPLSAEDEHHPHGEAPLPMVLALMTTAIGTIALFFFSAPLLRLVQPLVAS